MSANVKSYFLLLEWSLFWASFQFGPFGIDVVRHRFLCFAKVAKMFPYWLIWVSDKSVVLYKHTSRLANCFLFIVRLSRHRHTFRAPISISAIFSWFMPSPFASMANFSPRLEQHDMLLSLHRVECIFDNERIGARCRMSAWGAADPEERLTRKLFL